MKAAIKASKELAIERGIAPPSPRMTGISDLFRQMQPGDSVLVPAVKASSGRSIAFQLWGAGNAVCRKTEGGVRIWRLR